MAGNAQTAERLEAAKRRAFVLQARKAGATYREIAALALRTFGADALPKGWDERYAYKDIKRELDKLRAEIADSAENVLALELQRLDDLLKGLWAEAAKQQPDYKAVDRVLRVMERRAKLLGLDAPTRTDVTTDGEPLVQFVIKGADPEKL